MFVLKIFALIYSELQIILQFFLIKYYLYQNKMYICITKPIKTWHT